MKDEKLKELIQHELESRAPDFDEILAIERERKSAKVNPRFILAMATVSTVILLILLPLINNEETADFTSQNLETQSKNVGENVADNSINFKSEGENQQYFQGISDWKSSTDFLIKQ